MAKERDNERFPEERDTGCASANKSPEDTSNKETCSKGQSRRTRGKKSIKPSTNAARERSRVQNLKQAFLELQRALPNVPSGTKLSKLDILLLATNYISHLMSKLSNGHLKEHLSRLKDTGTLHPIKKWPMRSRLYVSDPMWLYRSSRQSVILTQSEDTPSPTSPSMSYEESSPSLDAVDLPSPSESQTEEIDSFSSTYRYSCRENQCYYPTTQEVEYNYPHRRTENSFMTSSEEHGLEASACLYQKTIPNLRLHQGKL